MYATCFDNTYPSGAFVSFILNSPFFESDIKGVSPLLSVTYGPISFPSLSIILNSAPSSPFFPVSSTLRRRIGGPDGSFFKVRVNFPSSYDQYSEFSFCSEDVKYATELTFPFFMSNCAISSIFS